MVLKVKHDTFVIGTRVGRRCWCGEGHRLLKGRLITETRILWEWFEHIVVVYDADEEVIKRAVQQVGEEFWWYNDN